MATKKNKNDIVEKIYNKLPEVSKDDLLQCCNIFFESISDELDSGNRVELRGFGTFAIRERLVPVDPRKNIDKSNSDRINCSSVYFRASKFLNEKINS